MRIAANDILPVSSRVRREVSNNREVTSLPLTSTNISVTLIYESPSYCHHRPMFQALLSMHFRRTSERARNRAKAGNPLYESNGTRLLFSNSEVGCAITIEYIAEASRFVYRFRDAEIFGRKNGYLSDL